MGHIGAIGHEGDHQALARGVYSSKATTITAFAGTLIDSLPPAARALNAAGLMTCGFWNVLCASIVAKDQAENGEAVFDDVHAVVSIKAVSVGRPHVAFGAGYDGQRGVWTTSGRGPTAERWLRGECLFVITCSGSGQGAARWQCGRAQACGTGTRPAGPAIRRSLSQGFGKSKDRNYASGEDIYKVQIIALILHFLACDLRRRRQSVTERMQARLARTRVIDRVVLSGLRSMTIRSPKP